MINSRCSRFTVTSKSVNPRRHPFSRSYRVILQSSLTSVLPSALDFSSRLPVSVLVRSPWTQSLEAFLGRPSDDYRNINVFVPDLRPVAADLPSPGNLRHSAGRILTCLIVTHSDIITSRTHHRSLRYGLYLTKSALLPRRSPEGSLHLLLRCNAYSRSLWAQICSTSKLLRTF